MDVDRVKEQYRAMGATDADIEKAGLNDQEAIAREGQIILQPNLVAWNLFSFCQNQWDTVISPMGRVIKIGLRWTDVDVRASKVAAVSALDETETEQLWRDLNTMESAALEAMRELRERDQ